LTKKNPIPSHAKSMEDCKQTHEINGDTVSFQVTCDRNDFQMESSGTMTYSGDSMQGHIKSHQVRKGKAMDSSIDISGQYLGPCE